MFSTESSFDVRLFMLSC